ncbi:MAG: type II secretion system F family protein [Chloroflexota bacterium]
MIAIALAAGAAFGIMLVFLGVRQITAPEVDVTARLAELNARGKTLGGQAGAARQGAISAGIERAVNKRSFGANMARDLARANLKLTVSEYIMVHILLAVLLGALTFLLTSNIIGTVALGAGGIVLPHMYVQMLQTRRLGAFNKQLSDTSGLIANSLRSGYSLLQSMEMVAREGPSPTAEEFQRVVREVGLGLTPEQALANLVRRMNSDDLDLMVTAINVQHEVGGNLAQILDSISHTIRERVRIKGEIKTLTAQVGCSGNVVSFLPIALTIVLFLLNPSYIGQLFQPGFALCLPAMAAGGIVAGYLVMRKITKIDV